jgi:hypothetical protein
MAASFSIADIVDLRSRTAETLAGQTTKVDRSGHLFRAGPNGQP